jgi:hypothetical protein
MSQRHSEYELLPGDCYYTPAWVTEALLSAEDFPEPIWEPACGAGHITRIFERRGILYDSSDLMAGGLDFLSAEKGDCWDYNSIITNPPYSHGLAGKFVRHALELTFPEHFTDTSECGKVAMLLPLAWDSAKGRRDLFKDHPAFKAKYILTKRIRWENLEQKKNGPSQNHAWYVWDWKHSGPPTLGYLP